ncbi:tandem-95 repeat protein [Methylobacterium brachythecii]|nr:tandem-95 repeat protein [Methylobacterium brachythecii]MBB3902799.1 hypothetical protein [Methylobacterium brachythecii]
MPAPAIRALEPRFVFDGAAAASAAQTQSDAAAQAHGETAEQSADTSHAEAADKSSAAPVAAGPHAETASANGRHEIVVIDKSVADWQTLLAGIPSSAEVILIDAGTDGFDRLADALKGRSDIDAIHILSHGSAGDLHLGSAELTAQSIQGRYAADLAIIGNALTATGDILIYGCDFAAGEVGARAAELLAQATGADVAASDDATGDTALGGDWDLEVHDGSIETGIIVSDAAQHAWHHLLAPVTITVNGDPTVKDSSGTAITTTRTANGFTYYDVSTGVVNSTALWQNVGTADGVAVDLRATVIGRGESDDTVSFASANNNAVILVRSTSAANGTVNNAGQITIKWEVVRHSDGQAVSADINFRIGDIDGIGSQPNTRETVTPSQFGLVSYTLASTTDLRVDTSNDKVRVSGTENENTANPSASPDSQSNVQFNWNGVTSWVVTYDLAANSVTGGAAFQHDGHQSMAITNPVTKLVPKVDLDADDSSGATGNDYKTTYTEKGSAVAITDTDPLVTNTAATVSSATIILTNAQAGDRLNIGTLPGGLTATTTTGSGTITVTISGDSDPATYQAALRAITFDSTSSDPSTTDRVVKTHVTSDGVQGTSSTATVKVIAVDDPPVNTVPTARTINEDTNLVFSSANGTAITVSDVDAEGGNLTTTLSVLHGVISLGSTSGLASFAGNGTGTVTLTGTVTAINAALNGTTYTPAADYNGNDTLTVTTNDNGNTGTGGPQSDTDMVSITVTPVNDAPVLDLDGSAAGTGYATSYTEGGAGIAIVNTNVSVSDVDNTTMASAKAIIVNGSTGDVLSISGTLPTGITATFDPSTYTLTLTGSATKADYQTALQQIRYASTSQDPSTVTRTIQVSVNDGALDSNTAVASVAFTTVNDPPVNTVPGGQTVAEDTALVFSTANGNRIAIADPDAETGNLTTTISVLHGNVTLGSTSGLSSFSGNGTGTVTLTGSLSAINAALDGACYQGTQDYNGPDTLTITTNDNGNTGTGGAKSDTDMVSITVTPVNDAPVLDLDAAAPGTGYATSYTEGGAGIAIADTDVSVTDVDSATMASARIVITNGSAGDALSVSGALRGGIVAAYDPSTYTLTLTGSATKADYQTALQQVRYTSSGQDPSTVTRTIAVTVNDGSLDSNAAAATITFTAVNDPPVNTVPVGQTVAEDTDLVFSTANANQISIADPDAGGSDVTTTVGVQHGSLTLGSTTGLTSVTGDGTGTVVLKGSISAINAALDGLRYRGSADYNGPDTLTVTTNDNGNTGSGGAKSDTDMVSITVTPVNDAPVNGLPSAQAVDEDTNLVFSTGNGNAITVSDVDAGGGSLTTTLSVQHGTLTLGGTNNVTVSGNGSDTVTLTGTIADVNAALNGTVYRGLSNFYGADTLSVVTDDNGNTGAGGAKQASDTLGITVRAVNDPPSNTVPATTQVLDEDTPIVFTGAGGNGISVADPDDASLTVTLSSVQGVLTLSQTSGLTFLQGDGTRDGILQFSGTVVDINAALEGLRFDPNADMNGAAQIALTTRDAQGATASSTIALSITPVADIVPDSVSTDEDTAITFNPLTGTNGASADNFESPAAYVSSVTQGAHGSVSFQADGTMTYTPAGDFNGTDSFTYTVTSGGTTETATVTVTVRPVNDAPVLDLTASAPGTGYATSYGEGGPGVAIVAADVSVSDVDSATMASAKLVITNGSVGDTLGIAGSLPSGITASFDAGTYTLTLTGSATRADYQAFLQQVRFSSDSHTPSTVTRSIAVTVNDGALDSNAAVATVAFGDVNDAPVNGMPADQSLYEDTPLVFSAANHNAITITDPDAGNGSLTTTLSVGHGTLTIGSTAGLLVVNDGTGSVTLTGTLAAINAALDGTTYRPAADYNGADSLTVLTNDNGNTGAGGAKTDTDTLALTILSVNDAPRAGTLPALGSLDGAVIGGLDLGRYFSDVEGDRLSFSMTGLPPGLTVDPATGRVGGTIDHSASQGGIHGDYTVTITADDGHGGLTSRAFTWRVVNPAPIARNDEAITDAASVATGSVLADNGNGPDRDPDGDPLSIAAVNGVAADVGRPVAGSAGGRFTVLADGSYRFDPGNDFADLAAGQIRTTQIGYTLSDGEGGVSQAVLIVTVTGRTLTPPVLAPTDATARDGESVSLPLAPLFPHPDDTPLTYGATGLPPGLAIDPATGIVSGTIDHAASGAGGLTDYRITVTATDPQGVTETRDVIYRVTNPAPTALDDVATTAEGTPVVIDVLANDISSDSDPLAIIASGDSAPRAGHGQVGVVNGQLVYTPDAHFNGRDTITYSIGDGNGGVSTATVIVTVTSVNDAPEAGTLPDLYGRDGDAVSYDVSSRFHDPDTDPSVVQAPSGDHLSFAATGLPPGLTIDPATGVISGTLPNDAAPVSHYTVTVTATDMAGASVSRSFTWTVSDDAPKPAPDITTTPAGSPVIVPVTANDVDPSGTAVHLVDAPGAASAGHGTVSVDPATGLLTYTPDTGFSGRDTIVYTVENANGDRATGILTVTVTAVNQRPTAPDTLASRNGVDGQSVNVPLGNLITDPDGDPLTYAAAGLPPGLSIDPATGAITGIIDHAASGASGSRTYVVTFTATDPGGLAVSRNLAWTVTNPAPTAADDAITTAEDTPVDIDVTANDHDPDGDPLSVVPGSAVAAHGTVTINPDGTLHYVPGRDFNGSDRILYTITDGNGGFATASVTVTVTPVNDAPVVDPASPAIADRSANDAQTVSIPAGNAFHDIDRGDRLSFSATGLPPGLSLDPATGLISGTLASDASTRVPGGTYTIALTGTDLAGASATARFTLTVANPAPIAVDDILTTAEDTPLTGNVLANDHDPDGDRLHVEPVTGPAHGRLDLHPDGTFTYMPDADFHGADSFTYALVDSDGGRATATVHLTVGAVNDAPVATADPLTVPANTVGTGRIVASDRDGDPLSFRVTGGPANGTLTLAADGSYAYRPYAGYSGSDRFTVEVSDGHGGLALVAVAIDVTPNSIQVPPTVPMPGLMPLFLAGERPAAPPVQPPASSLAAEGIILPAVAGIESLHSIGDVVLADGAVVAAVNGVAHLNGTVILPDHPVMLEEGQRIARMAWERFERMPIDDTTWFSPRPYLGRSLGVSLAADELGFGTSDLMVEAIRRPDTLSINLHGHAARLDSVAEVRLLGLDGGPPPDWIEGDGLGGFWGRPPAGTGIVRIELEIVLQDGRIVRRALSVDAETGEIRALPKPAAASEPKPVGKPAPEPARPAEVPLFSTQLAALGTRAAHDMALIERALTRLG